MTNDYGGPGDNGSDEKNFVEQLVQCLSTLKLGLGDVYPAEAVVVISREQFDRLVQANDRACDLLELRRAKLLIKEAA